MNYYYYYYKNVIYNLYRNNIYLWIVEKEIKKRNK
jgi:hypothetical protein